MQKFTLITGPMFSKKSAYIIENYINKDIQAFKPTIDTRDGDFIVSRDHKDKKIPCKKVDNFNNVKLNKEIIIIDEYQFFETEDLKKLILKCQNEKKELIMVGLDLTAEKKEWKTYTEIKKLCDKEIKLKAKCDRCGGIATFTKKITGNKNKEIEIDGDVKYEARCPKCWELD